MAHYEKVIDETLVLSRQNKDREARAKMSAVLSEYSELNQNIAELMTIERGGANEAIARIRTLRRFDTIVKRIVEGGGGSVLVKTQLGEGTTFVLQLPLAGSQGKARDLSAEFRPVDAA